MQKIKMYLNKVQIIGFILSTIMLILVPITKNYKLVSVGWFFIGLTSFGNALFAKEWSIIGRTWNEKDDKNPDKQLTKKYIAMIIAYILSAIVIVVLFVLIDKEHDKVEQLLPNIKNTWHVLVL